MCQLKVAGGEFQAEGIAGVQQEKPKKREPKKRDQSSWNIRLSKGTKLGNEGETKLRKRGSVL